MDNLLLVTRPKWDDGTEYLAYYASLVIKEAENRGLDLKDFEGLNVSKANILKFLTKMNPNLIFINGHGSESELYGNKDEIILSVEDISLLKDKFVYARACNAGLNFGKKMVDENNGCFIGYQCLFSFWIDQKWSAKPHNDNIAKLYLEPSNEIMISMIKGNTSLKAYEKSKNSMIENMKKILKMEEKNEPGAMNMLQVLWNNFEGQVLHGNKNFSVN